MSLTAKRIWWVIALLVGSLAIYAIHPFFLIGLGFLLQWEWLFWGLIWVMLIPFWAVMVFVFWPKRDG